MEFLTQKKTQSPNHKKGSPNSKHSFHKKSQLLALVLLFLFVFTFFLPPILKGKKNSNTNYYSFLRENNNSQDSTSNKKQIYLIHADSLTFDNAQHPDINQLKGHVHLQHDQWDMFCDSAYLRQKDNSFDAMENVKIIGDSVTINSRFLHYYGQDKIAQLRINVVLESKNATLYTDSLDYDRNLDLGYYAYSGTIVDSLNTLTSIYGEYTPSTSEAYFENNVVLENPDFTLYTEQLLYNTETKIAYFQGPTKIVSDSGYIESTRGIYDTNLDLGILLDRSIVFNKRGNITADSLLYNKRNKYCEAFGGMILNDTINKKILKGDYGYFDEATDFAFATVYASLEDYQKKDTLYIGADTLEMVMKKKVPMKDKNTKDVMLIRAYHRGRIYSKDIQGKADSISYFSHDSILSLYQSPIIWSDSIQLQGDTIRSFFVNDTLDHATIWRNAKSMKQLKKIEYFDQVAADSMVGRFENESIKELEAYGNPVKMIYFTMQESIEHYFGVGNIESPNVHVFFAGDTVQKSIFLGPVKGDLYPIEQSTNQERQISGLLWQENLRPKSPKDVILPLLDETGKARPIKPSKISDLSLFNGSLMALDSYQQLEKEIEKSRERAKLAEKKSDINLQGDTTIIELSQYIKRANNKDEKDIPIANRIIKPAKFNLWDSLIHENQDSLSTNQFLMIPRRMHSENEKLE